MNRKLVIFIAGVVVGRYLEKNKLFILPFREKCKIEDCKFAVMTNKPEETLARMNQHMQEKHPGWITR